MSLLAPWFLAGLALLAGPIIAHLVRRATRDRVTFSALRFLGPSAPPLNRRSRVQHPLLLALRCVIVALLAFGFARPFFSEPISASADAATPRHVVAVLDESASMRRTGLWDSARENILTLAASLRPADQFVLLGAGPGIAEVIGSAQWLATAPADRTALVRAVLDRREPGWGPTPLDSAAEAALARWEDMAESAGGAGRRELVIVSDFGSGSRIAGLASLDWPAGAQVVLSEVKPAVAGNTSLHWLGWSNPEPDRIGARVRVSRSFDAPGALRLRWHDARTAEPLGEPESFTLLPGASEVRIVPLPDNAPDALRLDLEDDSEDFDNRLWLVRPTPREINIRYLGAHAPDDLQHARFYVERGVAGWREPAAHVSTDLFQNSAAPALLIVAEPLQPAQLHATRARLEAGAFAVVLLDRDEMFASAAALAGETDWRPASAERPDALFGQLDFQHPLFAPFADPLYSDFTRIRFWQPRPIALPHDSRAAVVARFDDGTPAVLEVPVGRGRLVVWGGGWSPEASQWVLSSKFVPWLQALAERASGGPARPAIAELSDTTRFADRVVRFEPISLAHAQPAAANARSIEAPIAPGIYAVVDGDHRSVMALNVPSAESRTEPLALDVWEQLGVPLRADAVAAAVRAESPRPSAQATALEAVQKLWRWLLWAAVALLALESLTSFLIARRSDALREPTPRDLHRQSSSLPNHDAIAS